MAAFANFFCPGLGHLVLAKPFQALLWFVLVVIGYLCFIFPGIILHILCILDAARQSRRDAISAVQKGMERAMKSAKR